MAGVDVGGGGGKGKRSLDSEINMIPFIDLLMVTISFLLITAVWSHMARINADAQVPGPPQPDKEQQNIEPEKVLHLEMRSPEKFTIVWKQGANVVNSIDLPRKDDVKESSGGIKTVRYPDLAAKISEEWNTSGSHRAPGDKKLDQAVLHTDNDTQYMYVIGVIDAIYQTHRKLDVNGKQEDIPAFNVTFAVN